MRTPRLFVELPLAVGETVTLESGRAHYLAHVLRCSTGARVTLFNGLGGAYSGVVTATSKQRVGVAIEAFDARDNESPLAITLGLGVIKRDAMDSAIQKSTELGVREITPLICEFTDVKRSTLDSRVEHWRSVAWSACEQCERNRPPTINAPLSLDEWLAGTHAALRLVAHPGRDATLGDVVARPDSVALLTGPEGGFSEREIDKCVTSGFRAIGLGPRILRADTAPLVLISLIQSRFGDLGV